jgi:hypothetical protein
MPNYKNSQIYCIYFNGYFYIGSTTQPLKDRLKEHKSMYNRYINNKLKKKCGSFKILELELNPQYETIEFYECNSKKELSQKEREYILSYKEKYGDNCVNIVIPLRTHKEWLNDNQERVKQYGKNYLLKKNNDLDLQERKKETDKKYYENHKDKWKRTEEERLIKIQYNKDLRLYRKTWGAKTAFSNNLLDIKL